jgi:hypothetical protein
MSRTGSTSGRVGSWRSTPVTRQRGVGLPGITGASSQGIGQTASRDCVLGAKRERLSSRLGSDLQASMAKISGIM